MSDPAERILVEACPVCHGTLSDPVVGVGSLQVVRCRLCRLQYTNPQPSDRELAEIYGPDYFLAAAAEFSPEHVSRLKQATADRYCDLIESAETTVPGRRLLEIGCGHGDFLFVAAKRGFACTGVEYSNHACRIAQSKVGGDAEIIQGEVSSLQGRKSFFDICVMCDLIEHVRRPDELLRSVYERLRPGGLVFIATPTLDSWSARLLGSRWMEYKAEHLTYFCRSNLERLLASTHLRPIAYHRGFKVLSLQYAAAHFAKYPVVGITPVMRFLAKLTPTSLRQRPVTFVASGMILLAQKPAI